MDKHRSHDPRALEIVRLLQEQEQTDVAILFGSRANGSYEDGKSDIDIMLVQEEPPTPEQKKRAWETAQTLAVQRYQEKTSIQILWQTHQNFDRMRRTVNHVVASATREGIIVPRNQDDYSQRYESEFDNEECEWTVTDQRLRNAETHLYGLNLVHDAGGNDRLVGKNVQEAMEHALKAVISAAGVRYLRSHDMAELADLANQAVPTLRFEPTIPPNILNQDAGSDDYYDPAQPITGIEGYYGQAVSDLQSLIDKAREIQEARRAEK